MARTLEFFRGQALNVRTLEENDRKTRELEAAQELLRIEDLKKRHASFQLLFVSNPVSMWVHDANTGRIIAVNDAAVKHYGYNREAFLSMSTSALGCSDIELSELEPTSGDTQWHRTANGAEIEVAIYESFLTYEDCPAALIAAIDLTDRRRAERKILHLAHHDALTDLPTDTRSTRSLHQPCNRRRPHRSRLPCSAWISTDSRRSTTSSATRSATNCCKELSCRLTIAADGAFIARMGGDEFTIISTDRNQPAASKALAERLAAVVVGRFRHQRSPCPRWNQHRRGLISRRRTRRGKSARQRRRRALSRENRRPRQRAVLRIARWTDASAERHALQQDLRSAIERRRTHAPLPAAGNDRGRRSSASRRWCAGAIRRRGSSRRRRSSRSPKRAA